MRTIKKFSGALVVAAVMTSGMAIFSTPVYASTGTFTTRICTLLKDAEAAVNSLPSSGLKTYLLNAIHSAELTYKC